MLPKDASKHALRALFKRRPVAHLQALCQALDTRSRMSVFRRLRDMGYYTSYTHNGRYYTLAEVPEFDEYGLWRCEEVGFSQRGTLKATVAWRIEAAEPGCTQAELQALLRIPVHNTLLGLVRGESISRARIGGTYVYVSADEERAAQQLDARRRQVRDAAQPSGLPPDEVVLLVLVEALHAAKGLPTPRVVAARLTARGEVVAADQVERVYAHFGLEPEKKTAEPR